MRRFYQIALSVALLVIFLSQRINSLRCVECGGKDRCRPEPLLCIHGLVTDICECCMVCGQGGGEICGGLWNMRGKCGDSLVCVKPQSYPKQETHPEGTCRSHPTKRPLIIEDEELEGENATTTVADTAPLDVPSSVNPTTLPEMTVVTRAPAAKPTTPKRKADQKLHLINALTYSQWIRRRLRN